MRRTKSVLLSSGSILTSNKAMIQNQRIKIRNRAKESYGRNKAWAKRIRYARYCALFVFFAIQAFTIPRWCLIDDGIADKTWCDNDIYPNFDIPKVSIYVSYPIEMLAAIIIGLTTIFKRIERNLSVTEKIREGIIVVSISLICFEKFICLISGGAPIFSDFLKPLLMYAMFRNLREASARLFLVFWKSKNMIILLIIYYGLLGWISYRMFAGTSQALLYFSNRENGIWTMMMVYAGANFIVRFLPAYSSNRIIGIIYFVFTLIGIVFFMNVLIAILYHVYLAEVSDRIQNFKETVQDMLCSIYDKFKTPDERGLTHSQAHEAIVYVLEENTKGEYNKINIESVIKIMDQKNNGKVGRKGFYELFDILYVLLEVENNRKEMKRLESIVIPRWKINLSYIYKHRLYSGIINMLIILSLLLMFWRELMEVYGVNNSRVLPQWVVVAAIVNLIFFIDLVFNFIRYGIINSFKNFYILFEIVLQLISTAALFRVIIAQTYFYSIRGFELVILLRVFKLLQLLEELEQWRIIIKTLRHLLVPFLNLFLVQMGIVYTYAIIGERIYGGKISYNIISKLSEASLGKEYIMMNFNDTPISIVTLLYFSLAWANNVKVFTIAVPGLVSYVFTFTFFLLSFLCLWNIMVAVAIEVYNAVKKLNSASEQSKMDSINQNNKREFKRLKELEQTNSKLFSKLNSITLEPSKLKTASHKSPKPIHSKNYFDYEFSHMLKAKSKKNQNHEESKGESNDEIPYIERNNTHV